MVLPAANNELRDIGEHKQTEGDLQAEPKQLLVKLLEREVEYHCQLNKLREELGDNKNFCCAQEYENLSVGRYGIIMTSLNPFLGANGFYTRQTDTDAILRRFDHNANQSLDYGEFYELVTGKDLDDKEEKEEKDKKSHSDSDEDEKKVKTPVKEEEEKCASEEMKREDLASEGDFNEYTPGLK